MRRCRGRVARSVQPLGVEGGAKLPTKRLGVSVGASFQFYKSIQPKKRTAPTKWKRGSANLGAKCVAGVPEMISEFMTWIFPTVTGMAMCAVIAAYLVYRRRQDAAQ